VPGSIARAGSAVMIAALTESGDLAAAGTAGAAALAQCRDAGDLLNLPYMRGRSIGTERVTSIDAALFEFGQEMVAH
jgi:hypothetical protein